jgi:hypothetical protein
MNILCLLVTHKWDDYTDHPTREPTRGCLRCGKIQYHGLYFWHDFAKGWTYNMYKEYMNAKTPRERLLALGESVAYIDRQNKKNTRSTRSISYSVK